MRVGVDEAGKGPVLGPMIAAAVGVSEPAVLPDGVADSKRLSPERRERLAERLRADGAVRIGVAAVQVERIDDPATDMNSLAVAAQAEAVDAVLEEADANGVGGRADGVGSGADAAVGTSDRPDSGGSSGGSADSGSANIAVGANSADGADRNGADSTDERTAGNCTVLADACDTSEERFARRLLATCASDPELTARHGADDADPVVAAASVVAKVERDARVAALAERYGDVGSGYPSDPTTRQFLEAYVAEHDDLPDCARASWQTCADVLGAAAQSGLEEF